ncbi:MAG: hypothetical protein WCH79_18465, partial [Planctomycetia bacterium]
MGDPVTAARLEPLLRLPVSVLKSLAASLSDGLLSEEITQRGVEQAAGTDADAVAGLLRALSAAGFSTRHLAAVV